MLANVYTKTTTDRWRGVAIGSAVLVSFLLMAMAVYRDIDLSVYTELPEAFRSVIGIDQDADVGALAYNAVYSSYGALVLFSLALALGAAAIAGEERKGTIGLLLANPRSRSQVVLAKGAALVTLIGLVTVEESVPSNFAVFLIGLVTVVAAIAVLLGLLNLFAVHLRRFTHAERGWAYSLVALFAAVHIATIADGDREITVIVSIVVNLYQFRP